MSENLDKIYNLKTNKKEVKIAINEKDWETIEIIAKRVGGDFNMKVRLGEPGEGSYFNLEDCSITFDPLPIKDNLELAKFVAGHEGSHRAISRGPKEIGLPLEKIIELYSQIGFRYLQNVIEDPAVNDWMSKRFPGLKEYTEKTYNEQLKEENAILYAGDPTSEEYLKVMKFYLTHGYWPRFIQYGSEVIRDWHQKRFSQKLDPAVERALKRTIEYARESIKTIPDPQKLSRDEKEIVETARKRFENNTNWIWPEVKKLVEMDLHTEEIRQMLNDKELDPFSQLPEDVKGELQKQIDKAIRETTEKLNREIEGKQKEIEEAKQKQEKLDTEIKDLEEKAESASGKEKEELEKQIQEKKGEKLSQEMKQKKAEKELKEIQDTLKDIQSGKEIPYPEDKLSDKTKKELEKLFNKLPSRKKKEIEDKTKKELEDFEDTINEGLEGKLNKDKPESHRERREREKAEREAAIKSEEAKIERERMLEELEKIRREKMTLYERTRAELADLIDDLYYRLRRILKPEEYGGEETGYPTGQILDISRAMQAERDASHKYKLWIRETLPEKRDYRFWHLVDLSGSMEGEKIEETFKGFVVASEAIDRIENLNSDVLTIHQGITGFHNRIFPFKDIKERFTKDLERKLSTMLERVHDYDAGTNTYSATHFALEQLKQNLGETGNFLLTFSDGEPNYDIRESLRKILKNKEERKGVKVGLIWIGESPNEEMFNSLIEKYKDSLTSEDIRDIEDLKNTKDIQEAALQILVRAYGYDFGLVMPAVKPEKGKNFAQALADLLEDIVQHPEKY